MGVIIDSPQNILQIFKKKLSREDKVAFISTIIVGILTHIYLFTNNIFNSDGVLTGPYQSGYMWELSIGRWALEYFGRIGTGFTLPIVIGTISIICLGAISCLITNLFHLKESINIILVSCIIVTFPSITATFGFVFTADVYMISYLLSVLSLYIVERNKNLKGIAIGAIILSISMGIYQAYIGVSIMLVVILLILSLLNNNNIKKTLQNLFIYFIYGVLGTGVYFIILKIFLKIKNTTLASYRGIDEIGKITLGSLPSIIKSIYKYFYEFLFTRNIYYNSKLRMLLYALIILSILSLICIVIIKNKIYKNYISAVFIFILLLSIPIIAAIMKILAPNTNISMLMIPQFALVFVLPVILLEKVDCKNINLIKWITTVTCILLAFNYYLLDNVAYLNLQLQYEKAYSIANRITERIEMNEEYVPGMKVAIIGGLNNGNYQSVIPAEKEVLKGIDCIDYDYPFYDNETRSLTNFINNYIGVNLQETSREEIDSIRQKEEFKNMKNFPDKESVKVIDNNMVIKLSDI